VGSSSNINNAPEGYTDADVVRDYTLAWTGRGDSSHSWASDELHDMVHAKPERAWPIILSLIRESPADDFLAIVAAGPLEDLLWEHGAVFMDRVETLAAEDRHFRHALAGVCGSSQMSAELWKRLRGAVGDEVL
jgi:hypothetical protein